MFTASEASRVALINRQLLIDKQLEEVEVVITTAVHGGHMHCHYLRPILDETIATLIEQGFAVQPNEQLFGTTYTISWKEEH